MLGGEQALWRRHCGCGGDGKSCAKGYERAGNTHAIIHVFGKLYFIASNGFLEAKYFLIIATSLCVSIEEEKNHGSFVQSIPRHLGYMESHSEISVIELL